MKTVLVYCGKFFRSVRDRGFIKTVTLFYYEKIWVRRFGMDTAGTVDLKALQIQSPNVAHGIRYEPVNYGIFQTLFDHLPLATADCVFLDIGCGKGQALVFAAHHGVTKLYGVDFSEELVQTCRRNLALTIKSKKVTWEIATADATEYSIPDDVNVAFLFNPFDGHVLRHVFRNLNESQQRRPRRIYVLYANAELLGMFLEAGYRVIHSFHRNRVDSYVKAGSAVLVKEPAIPG